MGIIYNNAIMMLKAKKKGVKFDKILTLGHQKFYITNKQIKSLSKDFNIDISNFKSQYGDYSNDFFKIFLNTSQVESLDYSDYEKCDILHNMNSVISEKYHKKYDVVIDGGALEHIFNFPVAIANCMNMIKQEGSIFIFSMANNHMGHGFYQFSPELYFNVLNNNGFSVQDVILDIYKFPGAEISPIGKCFSVKNPAIVKSRISTVSCKPTLIMVHAIRDEVVDIFSTYPIQSDYIQTYNKKTKSKKVSYIRKIFNMLPQKTKWYIEGKMQLKKYSLNNKVFYSKWN